MHLNINGKPTEIEFNFRTSLLHLLRDHLELHGSKKGCNQGACGACTVLVDGERILSCLSLAVQYQGRNNILQRTRCTYFYDDDGSRCNKRTPGQGCGAIGGFNRIHAILGTSPVCIATHPSDMCVALAALDAAIHLSGPQGERIVPLTEFHRLPGETPHLETNLQHGELITAVELPPLPFARRSAYRKLREIDMLWADIADPHSPMGAHGIGEIGITGVGAALANAIHKRVRELPITLDKLM